MNNKNDTQMHAYFIRFHSRVPTKWIRLDNPLLRKIVQMKKNHNKKVTDKLNIIDSINGLETALYEL